MTVFFFKQKTAYEMRISDWSSDVCSSDLIRGPIQPVRDVLCAARRPKDPPRRAFRCAEIGTRLGAAQATDRGRRLDRKSVVEGKSVSVRVDLGGRRIIKKKQKETTHDMMTTPIHQPQKKILNRNEA